MYDTKHLMYIVVYILLLYCEQNSCTEDRRPVISLSGHVMNSSKHIKFLNEEGPLEIFCTGQDAKKLKIRLESGIIGGLLPTEILNKTTVRFFKEKKEKQMTLYRCWEDDDDNFSDLFIVVDELPNLRDFSCVSKNLVYLNCSWTSTNVLANFKVHLMNKEPRKICQIFLMEVATKVRHCSWKYNNYPPYLTEKTLRFTLEACNSHVCSKNQTVAFDHLSIVKLDPPENLCVLMKTPHGVLLQWEISYNTYKLLDGVEHRVEYRYPGIQPLEVNASSVVSNTMRYQLELHLPCANQYYEVRVSVRPTQAVQEEYWSDFATISFVTDQIIETKDGEGEAKCEKFDVDLTSEIMLYKLNNLRMKVMEEQQQLRSRISDLKIKAAQLNRQ